MRVVPMLLALAVVAAGCRDGKKFAWPGRGEPEPSAPANAPTTYPSSPTQPASSPADDGVVAYVNGLPIHASDLYDVLVRANGMRMVQHLIACRLVDQAATTKGLTVSDEEVEAEHEQTLARMFPGISELGDREKMLGQLFQRQRISRKQWRMSMRRNVLLGKLAAGQADPSEAEITEAFGEKYGRKVIARHIQLATLDEAQRVLELLRAGGDFQELARKYSISPSRVRGGLLPPVGPTPRVLPKVLHTVVWEMTRPGQISEVVQTGTTYHILQLERIEPPKNVKFEDVKEQLAREVRARKLRQAGQEILRDLVAKAEIRYVDPVLMEKAGQSREEQTK